jgi:hypothetical protein
MGKINLLIRGKVMVWLKSLGNEYRREVAVKTILRLLQGFLMTPCQES